MSVAFDKLGALMDMKRLPDDVEQQIDDLYDELEQSERHEAAWLVEGLEHRMYDSASQDFIG